MDPSEVLNNIEYNSKWKNISFNNKRLDFAFLNDIAKTDPKLKILTSLLNREIKLWEKIEILFTTIDKKIIFEEIRNYFKAHFSKKKPSLVNIINVTDLILNLYFTITNNCEIFENKEEFHKLINIVVISPTTTRKRNYNVNPLEYNLIIRIIYMLYKFTNCLVSFCDNPDKNFKIYITHDLSYVCDDFKYQNIYIDVDCNECKKKNTNQLQNFDNFDDDNNETEQKCSTSIAKKENIAIKILNQLEKIAGFPTKKYTWNLSSRTEGLKNCGFHIFIDCCILTVEWNSILFQLYQNSNFLSKYNLKIDSNVNGFCLPFGRNHSLFLKNIEKLSDIWVISPLPELMSQYNNLLNIKHVDNIENQTIISFIDNNTPLLEQSYYYERSGGFYTYPLIENIYKPKGWVNDFPKLDKKIQTVYLYNDKNIIGSGNFSNFNKTCELLKYFFQTFYYIIEKNTLDTTDENYKNYSDQNNSSDDDNNNDDNDLPATSSKKYYNSDDDDEDDEDVTNQNESDRNLLFTYDLKPELVPFEKLHITNYSYKLKISKYVEKLNLNNNEKHKLKIFLDVCIDKDSYAKCYNKILKNKIKLYRELVDIFKSFFSSEFKNIDIDSLTYEYSDVEEINETENDDNINNSNNSNNINNIDNESDEENSNGYREKNENSNVRVIGTNINKKPITSVYSIDFDIWRYNNNEIKLKWTEAIMDRAKNRLNFNLKQSQKQLSFFLSIVDSIPNLMDNFVCGPLLINCLIKENYEAKKYNKIIYFKEKFSEISKMLIEDSKQNFKMWCKSTFQSTSDGRFIVKNTAKKVKKQKKDQEFSLTSLNMENISQTQQVLKVCAVRHFTIIDYCIEFLLRNGFVSTVLFMLINEYLAKFSHRKDPDSALDEIFSVLHHRYNLNEHAKYILLSYETMYSYSNLITMSNNYSNINGIPFALLWYLRDRDGIVNLQYYTEKLKQVFTIFTTEGDFDRYIVEYLCRNVYCPILLGDHTALFDGTQYIKIDPRTYEYFNNAQFFGTINMIKFTLFDYSRRTTRGIYSPVLNILEDNDVTLKSDLFQFVNKSDIDGYQEKIYNLCLDIYYKIPSFIRYSKKNILSFCVHGPLFLLSKYQESVLNFKFYAETNVNIGDVQDSFDIGFDDILIEKLKNELFSKINDYKTNEWVRNMCVWIVIFNSIDYYSNLGKESIDSILTVLFGNSKYGVLKLPTNQVCGNKRKHEMPVHQEYTNLFEDKNIHSIFKLNVDNINQQDIDENEINGSLLTKVCEFRYSFWDMISRHNALAKTELSEQHNKILLETIRGKKSFHTIQLQFENYKKNNEDVVHNKTLEAILFHIFNNYTFDDIWEQITNKFDNIENFKAIENNIFKYAFLLTNFFAKRQIKKESVSTMSNILQHSYKYRQEIYNGGSNFILQNFSEPFIANTNTELTALLRSFCEKTQIDEISHNKKVEQCYNFKKILNIEENNELVDFIFQPNKVYLKENDLVAANDNYDSDTSSIGSEADLDSHLNIDNFINYDRQKYYFYKYYFTTKEQEIANRNQTLNSDILQRYKTNSLIDKIYTAFVFFIYFSGYDEQVFYEILKLIVKINFPGQWSKQFALFYGESNSGKSIFMYMLDSIFRTQDNMIPTSVLATNSELANASQFSKCLFVYVDEANYILAQRVKQNITDLVSGRQMFSQKFQTQKNKAKLFLLNNNLPMGLNNDAGINTRIWVNCFIHTHTTVGSCDRMLCGINRFVCSNSLPVQIKSKVFPADDGSSAKYSEGMYITFYQFLTHLFYYKLDTPVDKQISKISADKKNLFIAKLDDLINFHQNFFSDYSGKMSEIDLDRNIDYYFRYVYANTTVKQIARDRLKDRLINELTVTKVNKSGLKIYNRKFEPHQSILQSLGVKRVRKSNK